MIVYYPLDLWSQNNWFLGKKIQKKFNGESHKIVKLLRSVEENPLKGKSLGNIAGFLIKELKYKKFRFYFIVEGDKLKFYNEKELVDLLMRFFGMSDKKSQQKTINEIRNILIKIGPEGF